MKQFRWILPVLLVFFLACGGGEEATTGPAATAQEAAKRCLKASIAGDEQAFREVVADDVEEQFMYNYKKFNTSLPKDKPVNWNPVTARKFENKAWLARVGGSIITFEMKEVSAGHWEVVDILTND